MKGPYATFVLNSSNIEELSKRSDISQKTLWRYYFESLGKNEQCFLILGVNDA